LGGFMRFILCIVFSLATAVILLLAARAPDDVEKSAAREVDDEEDSERDDADHASAWLGMIVHALLSWKAHIGRMIRGEARARTPMPVAQGPRREPRFDGEDDEYEDEGEEDDDEDAPAPRRRAAARVPSRRGGNGYTLPSLNLLAVQRASERTTLS